MSAARKWGIVALLGLGIAIANVDRLNLSIVLAVDEFRRAFHVTDMDRGLLNSAFFWVYAFLQVPAGWVVDRFGVKYPYAIGFAFCSAYAGLLLSYHYALPSGPAIVLTAGLLYVFSVIAGRHGSIFSHFFFRRHYAS